MRTSFTRRTPVNVSNRRKPLRLLTVKFWRSHVCDLTDQGGNHRTPCGRRPASIPANGMISSGDFHRRF